MFIPETVLFSNGKAEKVIKTDADGCVTTSRGAMGIPELKKHLEASLRDRKREQEKKQMQMRYEQTAALKKAAAEQVVSDALLTPGLDMLQPKMVASRSSVAISDSSTKVLNQSVLEQS